MRSLRPVTPPLRRLPTAEDETSAVTILVNRTFGNAGKWPKEPCLKIGAFDDKAAIALLNHVARKRTRLLDWKWPDPCLSNVKHH